MIIILCMSIYTFIFYDFVVVYWLSLFLGARSYGITVLIKSCPRRFIGDLEAISRFIYFFTTHT